MLKYGPLQKALVFRLPGNNYKSTDLFNQQFCKAIPKNARKDIIVEWEKLVARDYVTTVQDLPAEDQHLVSNSHVRHYMAQTVAYKEYSHSTKMRICWDALRESQKKSINLSLQKEYMNFSCSKNSLLFSSTEVGYSAKEIL